MNNFLSKKSYSPFIVGGGIGVLSWITIYFMGKTLGTTTSFMKIVAAIYSIIAPTHTANSEYLSSLLSTPIIFWQTTLVLFAFFGAMVSAKLSKTETKDFVPSLWKKNFGSSVSKRRFWSIVGGVLLAIGARIAGGCTSGHGISGGLKLAISGWIFVAALFSAAIITAKLIYRKG